MIVAKELVREPVQAQAKAKTAWESVDTHCPGTASSGSGTMGQVEDGDMGAVSASQPVGEAHLVEVRDKLLQVDKVDEVVG